MFKMFKKLLGLVLGIVMVSGVGYGQNLLTNGGFEQNFDNWLSWVADGNEVLPIIDTTIFSLGAKSANLKVLGKGTALVYMRSDILELGAEYKLTAKVYIKSVNLEVPYIYYRLWEDDVHVADISAVANKSLLNVWQTISVNFIHVSSNNEIVNLRLNGIGECNFDDVVLELVSSRAIKEVYYNNILANPASLQADKNDANNYFKRVKLANGYAFYRKGDYVQAIPILESVDSIHIQELVGDIKLELLDLVGAKTAYSKAQAMAITQGLADKVKTLGNKIEGVNLAIKQNQPEPAPTTP